MGAAAHVRARPTERVHDAARQHPPWDRLARDSLQGQAPEADAALLGEATRPVPLGWTEDKHGTGAIPTSGL